MDTELRLRLRDAIGRIRNEQPISQEMGEALLLYCAALEEALEHTRREASELRRLLATRAKLVNHA